MLTFWIHHSKQNVSIYPSVMTPVVDVGTATSNLFSKHGAIFLATRPSVLVAVFDIPFRWRDSTLKEFHSPVMHYLGFKRLKNTTDSRKSPPSLSSK